MSLHDIKSSFEWKWNPNSVLSVILIFTTVLGVGAMYAELKGTIDDAQEDINLIAGDVRSLQQFNIRLTTLEQKVATAEVQTPAIQQDLRSLNQTVHGLSADLRVTVTILERLERSLQQPRSPPPPTVR